MILKDKNNLFRDNTQKIGNTCAHTSGGIAMTLLINEIQEVKNFGASKLHFLLENSNTKTIVLFTTILNSNENRLMMIHCSTFHLEKWSFQVYHYCHSN